MSESESPTPILHPRGSFRVRLEKTHMVPMRDGVRLSTDLYFPEGAMGPFGTVLERTPYSKNQPHHQYAGCPGFSLAEFFASHGFVFARQDKRGKFESEGEYTLLHDDVDDADDTLTWIAGQSWSNGRVGMIGCSYPGCTQLKAAQSLNPHLAALVPQSADGRHAWLWIRGGGLALIAAAWCHAFGSKEHKRPQSGLSREELIAWFDDNDPAEGLEPMEAMYSDPGRLMQAYLTLPVTAVESAIGDGPDTDWVSLTQPSTNRWWAGTQALKGDTVVDVPALHVNGWHDYGIAETFWLFDLFRRNARSAPARDNQFVIIAPTSHCAFDTGCSEQTLVGERDMGDASFDFLGTYLKWYDRWLNGNEAALDGMARIQYYNVGVNEWRVADEWPLPDTQYTVFYLTSDGHANSRYGDGRLQTDAPSNGTAYDSYVHDPATPVIHASAQRPGVDMGPYMGSSDRRELENRADVLVYTGEPLDEPVNVTGPMRAVLYLASTAVDTDVDVTLVDVFPDGRAMGVYGGMLRVRYRDGCDRPTLMQPGEIYRIEVDMHVTSITFLRGHRIRIEIASSRFPFHDRNLGTGGDNVTETDWIVATNTIHHSSEHPSHVVLPVIPRS